MNKSHYCVGVCSANQVSRSNNSAQQNIPYQFDVLVDMGMLTQTFGSISFVLQVIST